MSSLKSVKLALSFVSSETLFPDRKSDNLVPLTALRHKACRYKTNKLQVVLLRQGQNRWGQKVPACVLSESKMDSKP